MKTTHIPGDVDTMEGLIIEDGERKMEVFDNGMYIAIAGEDGEEYIPDDWDDFPNRDLYVTASTLLRNLQG